MRRYIKTMREQFDNNSVIFKEAKKMFHYVPGNAENRSYGKAKQQKSRVSEQTNQFKDDFSSVKELKNESNDVNESSWIAKLVNGIQEHSLEDVKVPLSKEFKARLSAATVSNEKETKEQSKSIKSDNVIIITGQEKMPLQEIANNQQQQLDSNQIPTKKNSYNFKKKVTNLTEKVKTKTKNQSFTENSEIVKPKNRVKTVDNGKQLQKNGSRSQVKVQPAKRELGPRKKSLQNIYLYRPREQSKCKSSMGQKDELQLSPLEDMGRATTEKKSNFTNNPLLKSKINESILEMEEIKHVATNPDETLNLEQNNEKQNFLKDKSYEPLFDGTNKEKTDKYGDTIVKGRSGCGSIRKNSKKLADHKPEEGSSFKQESTEAVFSPKFYSNSKLNEAIIQKSADIDIVTASEEKVLVEKYLKLSKNQRRPTAYDQSPLPTKKDAFKRYQYDVRAEEAEPTLNAEMLQPASNDFPRRTHLRSYCENQHNLRQISQPEKKGYWDRGQTNSELLQVRNRYTHRTNMYEQRAIIYSRNTTSRQKVRQDGSVPGGLTKCSNVQGASISKQKPTINKNAYLQQQSESSLMQSYQVSKKKNEFGTITHISKPGIPSKYSYIAFNSAARNQEDTLDHCSSGDKKTTLPNAEGSEGVIDRLNSKLSVYISQHGLGESPRQWREEATHRVMHLSFNQLKKHGEILRR